MDTKKISLLLAITVLVLFLFLEVTGVISVDEQGASAGDSVDSASTEEEIVVDTTPSALLREELTTVLASDGSVGVSNERLAWTQSLSFYPVVRTVDGDTIVISINGEDETIRLIGVDTPETVHPSKPVECFGREASAFTKALVMEAGSVALEVDESQGERDRYGRLLGYAILPDGRNLNALIIYEGYGYEYTYRTEYQYQAEFKLAEEVARTEGRGLWGENVCN